MPHKFHKQGLARWLSGEESACQCRRLGFDPCSGNIPHATEQRSLCATTIEPVLLKPGAATSEAHMPYSLCSRAPELESNPHSRQLEKSLCSNKDPAQIRFLKKKKVSSLKKKIIKCNFFLSFYRNLGLRTF